MRSDCGNRRVDRAFGHGPLAGIVSCALLGVSLAGLLVLLPGTKDAHAREGAPATLEEVLAARPSASKRVEFADERRRAAMRDAALSFGMQSGLVRRTHELRRLLEGFERQLDRIYRFDRLLIARDGFLVSPPVVVETNAAFRLAEHGKRAATARRVLRIAREAEVLGGAPGWREYFERSWEAPRAPSTVLFPRTPDEETLWRAWVSEGWSEGTRLAEDTFESDLDRLNRDFVGIVTWRILERQRIVTAPGVEVTSTAVVGGGAEMRVDARELEIREDARLNPVIDDWRVIEETAPWPR